jgi:hypothetical protein
MKILCIAVLALLIAPAGLSAQQMVAAKMANVQLIGSTADGADLTAESSEMQVEYEPGLVTGTLIFSTLSSMYPEVDSLLSRIVAESVIFQVEIPEGRFRFGDTMNEKFSAEGVINPDKDAAPFMMDFDVTNLKTNDNNTFQIIGRSTLSLREHFGIEPPAGSVHDMISFVFSQNVEVLRR